MLTLSRVSGERIHTGNAVSTWRVSGSGAGSIPAMHHARIGARRLAREAAVEQKRGLPSRHRRMKRKIHQGRRMKRKIQHVHVVMGDWDECNEIRSTMLDGLRLCSVACAGRLASTFHSTSWYKPGAAAL